MDNGPGIHKKDYSKVFTPGYTTKSEGTGLGLFLARTLTESINGRIGIEESIIFVGTSFIIGLPLFENIEGNSHER